MEVRVTYHKNSFINIVSSELSLDQDSMWNVRQTSILNFLLWAVDIAHRRNENSPKWEFQAFLETQMFNLHAPSINSLWSSDAIWHQGTSSFSGLGSGFMPVKHQTITQTNAGSLSNNPWGIYFREYLIKITMLFSIWKRLLQNVDHWY